MAMLQLWWRWWSWWAECKVVVPRHLFAASHSESAWRMRRRRLYEKLPHCSRTYALLHGHHDPPAMPNQLPNCKDGGSAHLRLHAVVWRSGLGQLCFCSSVVHYPSPRSPCFAYTMRSDSLDHPHTSHPTFALDHPAFHPLMCHIRALTSCHSRPFSH